LPLSVRLAVLPKRFAKVAFVDQRFVEEAVVAKKLVVVAAVVVERTRLGRN
jgi:hypothetical protein